MQFPSNRGMGRRWKGFTLLAVASFLVFGVFFGLGQPASTVQAASWTGPISYSANIGNITVRTRPSDGKTFVIGENVYGINKEGASLYYLSEADGFRVHTLVKAPVNSTAQLRARATFDASDNLHVVFGNWGSAYYVKLDTHTGAITGPTNITKLTGGATQVWEPDIAANTWPSGDKSLDIIWSGWNNSGFFPQVVVSYDGGATWNVEKSYTTQSVGYHPKNRIAVAPNGNVYAGYILEGPPSKVYSVVKSGGVWSSAYTVFNSGGDFNQDVAVAADSNSNGYVVFDSPMNGRRGLNIATWDATQSSGWKVNSSVTGVLEPARLAGISAVGTGDGNIWVAYDLDNGEQRYVAGKINGSGFSISDSGRAYNRGDAFAAEISWGSNRINLVSRIPGYIGFSYATGGGSYSGVTTPPSPPPPPSNEPPPPPPPPPGNPEPTTPPSNPQPTTPPATTPVTSPTPTPSPSPSPSPSPAPVETPQQSSNPDPAFSQVWNRTDDPVLKGLVSRSWMWSDKPSGFALLTETYDGKQRQVEYHDKSRMEVNNPNGNRNDLFFVTNGLLVRELISGKMQTGDATFENRQPANVAVAGDPNVGGANPNSPTYASFQNIASLNNDRRSSDRTGQTVTTALSKDGSTRELGTPPTNVKLVHYDDTLGHNIPDVFWNFMNSQGKVLINGAIKDDTIVNWIYAMGHPLSEAFWTRATVAGVEKDVLVQVFERRVLTYTPGNPAGFQVEMGNVGLHYYKWRYSNPS